MRFLSYLAILVTSFFVVACGGGGGSAGTVPGGTVVTPLALVTTIPTTFNMTPGSSRDFTVSGGTLPYSATSSDLSVAASAVVGNVVTVGAIGPGTAQIVIRDATGTVLNSSLTVTVPTLFTTAPSSVTLAIGSAGAQTYTIGGGAPPYRATSTNRNVVDFTSSGSTLVITGISVGSATVTVFDNLGKSVAIPVTVVAGATAAFFTTAPAAITAAIGSTSTFAVGGGTAPYLTPASTNASVATASLSGNTLTINALSAGTATIQLRDSSGAILTIAVTVSASQITLNPTTVNALIGDTLYSTISGGMGPYTLVESFPSAADVDTGFLSTAGVFTPNTSGNVLRIVVKQAVGSGGIVVRDAGGNQATFTLTAMAGTVATALSPSALSVSELGPYTVNLTLYGAVGTVNLFSTDTALLTVPGSVVGSSSGTTVTVTKTATCVVSATEVTITAIDSQGSTATSVFTIKDSVQPCP